MSDFAAGLEALEPSRRGKGTEPRVIPRILAALDDDDRQALQAAIEDPLRFPANRLAKYLTDRGFPISHSAISNWRIEHGYR